MESFSDRVKHIGHKEASNNTLKFNIHSGGIKKWENQTEKWIQFIFSPNKMWIEYIHFVYALEDFIDNHLK